MVRLIFVLMVTCAIGVAKGKLHVGFYNKSCPKAEAIVHGVVREAAISDHNNLPILLRLHYHDCFVHGCDASILINTGVDGTDERSAPEHLGVRGFEIVDRAKARLEGACPRVVSCSDIVALAARDAVFLAKGRWYEVETGRRDGMVSNITLADHMPAAGDSIHKLKSKFLPKASPTKILFSSVRLYGFGAGGGSDPSINPGFLGQLKSTCPNDGDGGDIRLPIDWDGEKTFDSSILRNIRRGFAVLQSDAALYQDKATKRVVDSYFGPYGPSFEADFAASMVKMGRIGVLTGSQGKIRRVCSSFD